MKKPHTVSIYDCKYDGDSIAQENIRSTTTFNENQEVVKRLSYDESGNLVRDESYEHNDGKITKSIEKDLSEGNTTEASQTYEGGLLLKQKEYYNSELTLEMNYSYDDQKRIIKNEILNNDGSLSSLYKYEYIDNLTIEDYFDEEMTLVRKTETRQNEEGRIVEKKVTEIYDNREVVRVQKVEIEVEDLETIETYYIDGRESFEIVKEINNKEQLIETSEFDIRSEDEVITQYAYNDAGKMVKEVKITNDEITLTKEHSYDDNGNIKYITEKQLIAEDYTHISAVKFVNEY